MANPPFNVKKVDKKKDYVKNDVRLFNDVGIPKADNGNYLWIQYFYHYLNEQGRAGFVMASSATDAGNTEKAIRQKLVETGAVDCIVSVGNNFFYTRSLPCHVWFLDKGKRKENKDKILMIDARNTFRVVTNTINDYSPGQLTNFNAIMESYRGDETAIASAQTIHNQEAISLGKDIANEINQLRTECKTILAAPNADDFSGDKPNLDFSPISGELDEKISVADDSNFDTCQIWSERFNQPIETLFALIEQYQAKSEKALADCKAQAKAIKESKEDKKTKAQSSKKNALLKKQLDANNRLLKSLNAVLNVHKELLKQELADYKQHIKDWHSLRVNFPGDQYNDVEGLCKIVSRDEAEENDYSLNPGRYVGNRPNIDLNYDYGGRIKELNKQLTSLNNQANDLMSSIVQLDL
jgi:type I restriction enzyme M protein